MQPDHSLLREPNGSTDDPEFGRLIEYLRVQRGFDYSGYKPAGLLRRIQKRMRMLGIEDLAGYRHYLEASAEESALLLSTVLIKVTEFFRDPAAWQVLSDEIVPKLLQSRDPDQPIRIWSAGCSTGEECHTLAMVFAEALGRGEFLERVEIHATDIDEAALARARAGRFGPRAIECLPPTLLEKYFALDGGQYAFAPELHRCLRFDRNDLARDEPIPNLDLLVCRNTLMYFNTETQSQILARFHSALRDDGYLFLGRAEMLLARGGLFTRIESRARIFSKAGRHGVRERPVSPSRSDLWARSP